MFFRKIWRILFSCCLRFVIHLFALLPTLLKLCYYLISGCNIYPRSPLCYYDFKKCRIKRKKNWNVASNEQKVTNNEWRITSNKQKVTSKEKKVTSNEQNVKINEQQTKRYLWKVSLTGPRIYMRTIRKIWRGYLDFLSRVLSCKQSACLKFQKNQLRSWSTSEQVTHLFQYLI